MYISMSLVITSLISLSWAHMQMSWPFPIRSPLDPANNYNDIDYSYTSPLLADGSNYPCKGYQTDTSQTSKATYIAGQTYNMTLAGTATHDGGSCQLSLSYDNGQTFKVIESMIGGCPLTSTYDFTIPTFAPSSSNALFAWTWFNTVGNREMYMNCARVTIESSNSTTSKHRRTLAARLSSMDSLPSLFTCDIGNGCTTVAQEDVQFPDPGSSVIYGTDAIQTVGGVGYSISGVTSATIVARTATATTGTGSTASTTASTTLQTQTKIIVSPVAVSNSSATSTTTKTSTSSATVTSTAASTTTSLSGPCTVGSFACNSQSTWSECVSVGSGSTSYVYMGSVPAGMECINGAITRTNSGSCSTDGAIVCSADGNSFYECANGGLISMGPVAAGTVCADGVIMYAEC